MRLKHRSGVRWGELIALRPWDLDFEPNRVVRILRSVALKSRQSPKKCHPMPTSHSLMKKFGPRQRRHLALALCARSQSAD